MRAVGMDNLCSILEIRTIDWVKNDYMSDILCEDIVRKVHG